jgi:hypothetical protein
VRICECYWILNVNFLFFITIIIFSFASLLKVYVDCLYVVRSSIVVVTVFACSSSVFSPFVCDLISTSDLLTFSTPQSFSFPVCLRSAKSMLSVVACVFRVRIIFHFACVFRVRMFFHCSHLFKFVWPNFVRWISRAG